VPIVLVTAEHLPELDPDSRLLLGPLEELGVDVEIATWSDPDVDWGRYDAVVVRSTWDYHDREEEFLGWIDRVEPLAPMVNPAPVLRWNAHKTYLRDLGDRGVPVVETLWLDRGERATVPWDEAIVKPAVSASSIGLERVARGEEVAATGDDLLVQPLVESIATEGELSLFYAGGAFSHMVRKVPKAGDVRSQPEFGSEVAVEAPAGEALAAAESVLDHVEHHLAYARVDLVRTADGRLSLIELEAIEPNLYLLYDPEAPRRFAEALSASVAAPRG
jgi:hypothetical protein